MIADKYDLNQIIQALEATLQIDGKDYDLTFDELYRKVCNRLSTQNGIDLYEKTIDDDTQNVIVGNNSVYMFVSNCASMHGMVSGYGNVMIYLSRNPKVQCYIPKGSVLNYCTASPEEFRKIINAMRYESYLGSLGQVYRKLESEFSYMAMSLEKRIMLCILITHRFGLYELTAALANLFHLGAII